MKLRGDKLRKLDHLKKFTQEDLFKIDLFKMGQGRSGKRFINRTIDVIEAMQIKGTWSNVTEYSATCSMFF